MCKVQMVYTIRSSVIQKSSIYGNINGSVSLRIGVAFLSLHTSFLEANLFRRPAS